MFEIRPSQGYEALRGITGIPREKKRRKKCNVETMKNVQNTTQESNEKESRVDDKPSQWDKCSRGSFGFEVSVLSQCSGIRHLMVNLTEDRKFNEYLTILSMKPFQRDQRRG